MTDSGSRPRESLPGPSSSAPPGWDFLFTEAGLGIAGRASAQLAGGAQSDSLNAALRREGLAPEQVAAVLTQAELRAKAEAKFGELSPDLLFTRAGLEQATRAEVAALHAARFRGAGIRSVADLGCGIGAESLALLGAGVAPLPVELDPLTARIAQHNLAVAAERGSRAVPEVVVGDAESVGPRDAEAAFLDPARRTAGHSDTRRLASPDDYSPSLSFAFGLAAHMPVGVKLGPGLDHELIPDDAEAQWVSVGGQLVETGVWFGALARPGIRRSALVLGAQGAQDPQGAHEPQAPHELAAQAPAADAQVRPLGEFLFEPDGAVIRARLIGRLAELLGAGMVSPGIAYLTGDDPVTSPFAQSFRILEELPAREKELRRALQQRDIGRLEIKKRGADVDPAALRKRLKLRGAGSATLFLTRAEGRHVALLAERLRP
ncbi:THUMP-like domain-containing protein [Leucobacter luti]|uniref:THUMP-like domain-containing protein n=1 Tax=Leucobacter luti TaxID=340320 RepID=UPI003CFBC70F